MKRRDKGWGEADSQRAQSTSQPKSPSKARELTGRPAAAVHLHVDFTHHVGGYRNLVAVLGKTCPSPTSLLSPLPV